MYDKTIYGSPEKLDGLQKRILVFNSDFVERNLQWTSGSASPVFFIGADQAEAAAKLAGIEEKILQQTGAKAAADTLEKGVTKRLAEFKRERAKLTASRLHLGNRRYEGPALAKDFENWGASEGVLLTDAALQAAEDTLRLAAPLPVIAEIEFDAKTIGAAYQFIVEICSQSLTMASLTEIEKFPDMLMWLKQGQEFHATNALSDCLFCGSPITERRKALLAAALDDKINEFITRLKRTAARLESVFDTLITLEESIPVSDALSGEVRPGFVETRSALISEIRNARGALRLLREVLSLKQEKPAVPADISRLPEQSEVQEISGRLANAIFQSNASISEHNKLSANFSKHKEEAEIRVRKHFIEECRADYENLEKELSDAATQLAKVSTELIRLGYDASTLTLQIREHGAAAKAINQSVASYVGHGELTIHPINEGYQIHRHGEPIHGSPSEGEKTAIALSYFLSSIEAEGRKKKDLIVVVDDPVSSLDTKALNYACALVRSRLSEVGQLFVMTHNLQCMNEFRKSWKKRVRPLGDKEPTASFFFIDVALLDGQTRRTSTIVPMPRLLREYDSEYHFLFSHVLQFTADPGTYYERGYMMPNVLRRVLDVFLAFKCPGSSGLAGQVDQLCTDYTSLDRDQLSALERLAQVESHSDNLDDLLSFSSMTLEESRAAADSLLRMMEVVDPKHLTHLRRLCR
jgi:wobble nucleotide-excising tRNase